MSSHGLCAQHRRCQSMVFALWQHWIFWFPLPKIEHRAFEEGFQKAPQPDSLFDNLILPALATCPTFTWMLALFKCWKCGCSESEMQQHSELRGNSVWGIRGSFFFLTERLWKADMCIIPIVKVQIKAFATVSFADCRNISVAMWSLELLWVRLVTLKNWDIAKGKACNSSGRYVLQFHLWRSKGKGLRIPNISLVDYLPFVNNL